MEINGKRLGVTFYCPDTETFQKVAKLRNVLEENGIATMWSTHDWNGAKVTSLDVYENANIVAEHLGALNS